MATLFNTLGTTALLDQYFTEPAVDASKRAEHLRDAETAEDTSRTCIMARLPSIYRVPISVQLKRDMTTGKGDAPGEKVITTEEEPAGGAAAPDAAGPSTGGGEGKDDKANPSTNTGKGQGDGAAASTAIASSRPDDFEAQVTRSLQPRDRLRLARPIKLVPSKPTPPETKVASMGSTNYDPRSALHDPKRPDRRTFDSERKYYDYMTEHGVLEGDHEHWRGLQEGSANVLVKAHLYHQDDDPLARIEFVITLSWVADGRYHQRNAMIGVTHLNLDSTMVSQSITARSDLRGRYLGADATHIDEDMLRDAVEFAVIVQGARIYSRNVLTDTDFGPHTQLIRNLAAVIREDHVIYFVLPRSVGAEIVDSTLARIQAQKERADYFHEWVPADRESSVWEVNAGRILPLAMRPTYAVAARVNYLNEAEYIMMETYGLQQEHEIVEVDRQNTLKSCPCRLLSVPGTENRQLVALLQRNADHTLELEPGDEVEICIHALDPDDRHRWQGTVMEPLPCTRAQDAPICISRPYSADTRNYVGQDPNDLSGILDTARLPAETARATAAIDEAKVYIVDVHRRVEVKQHRRRLLTISNLQDTIEWEDNLTGDSVTRTIILGNRFDNLPTVDFLLGVPQHVIDEVSRSLDNDQRELLRRCRAQPGGLAILVGPAGTGKTYLALRLALAQLHAHLTTQPRLLLLSPLNENVDSMAREMQELLRGTKGDVRDCVVIRLQSLSTERDIIHHEARQKQLAAGNTAMRPANVDRELRDRLMGGATQPAQLMNAAFGQASKGFMVPDPRVKEDNYAASLGYQVKLLAGTVAPHPDVPNLTSVAANQGKRFAELGELLARSGHVQLDNDESMKLSELVVDAIRWVLTNAHVICCTMDRASDTSLYTLFRPTMIVADEQARALAAETRAIWANFPCCHRRLLLGDPYQSKPQTRSTSQENNFALQLHLSEFTRLLVAGFPCSTLKVQKRFAGTINALVSINFYHGELQEHRAIRDSADADVVARTLKNMIGPRSSYLGNAILVEATMAEEQIEVTMSKCNRASACVTWYLLEELTRRMRIAADRIAILTPYRGQRRVHEAIRMQLVEKGDTDYRSVMIETWDKMQGLQRDFVIADVTTSQKLGFLREATRVNTGLSRAKFGLLIVADRMGLRMDKCNRDRALLKVFDYLMDKSLVLKLHQDRLTTAEDRYGAMCPVTEERARPAVGPGAEEYGDQNGKGGGDQDGEEGGDQDGEEGVEDARGRSGGEQGGWDSSQGGKANDDPTHPW